MAQKIKTKVSSYKGVGWDKASQKWKATVTDKRVTYECGYFEEERAAAKARDLKIIALRLNKPLQILKPV
ncbi:AP2 domain-containing protein [Flavobacterium sp. UMI-01]|uniref:AP2 domain-containing protein n=1 Tax=Flavobacterium sp. UMI-01 TaxID=1441053 RepID=UPI001C7DBDB5|nr:AP2 domain-containing protein [Flavobacterium sp. UMI-01]GIZ08353.1 hypothetical protein FUMI01_10800 [Flavobacterium sp. UMI-01]